MNLSLGMECDPITPPNQLVMTQAAEGRAGLIDSQAGTAKPQLMELPLLTRMKLRLLTFGCHQAVAGRSALPLHQ